MSRSLLIWGILDYRTASRTRVWLVVRPGSLWVGAHWSGNTGRLCINVLPCITVAVVYPGGADPV